jgi:hypothetical protein
VARLTLRLLMLEGTGPRATSCRCPGRSSISAPRHCPGCRCPSCPRYPAWRPYCPPPYRRRRRRLRDQEGRPRSPQASLEGQGRAGLTGTKALGRVGAVTLSVRSLLKSPRMRRFQLGGFAANTGFPAAIHALRMASPRCWPANWSCCCTMGPCLAQKIVQ